MATTTECRLERVREHRDRWVAALRLIVGLIDDRNLDEIAAELRRKEILFLDAARRHGSSHLRVIAGDCRLALAAIEREIREREEAAHV